MGSYSSDFAVDGVIPSANPNNFSHTAVDRSTTHWWQVNYSTTALGLAEIYIFNRSGFESRLDDFTIDIWNGDPSNGGTLVQYWADNASFSGGKSFTLDTSAKGTYLRITDGAGTECLTLPEVLLFVDKTDVGGYGSTATQDGNYYWATPFTQSSTGTLVMDWDLSGTAPTHDVLDVAGSFTAGGTIQMNVISGATLTAGEYELLKADSFSGTFASVVYSNDFRNALENASLLSDSSTLATSGKLTLQSMASDDAYWKNTAAAGADFATAGNWVGTPSGSTLYMGVYAGDDDSAVLSTTVDAAALVMGREASTTALTINTGGTLTTTGNVLVGNVANSTATLTVNGGTLDATGILRVDYGGTLRIDSGSVSAAGGSGAGHQANAVGQIAVNGGSLTFGNGLNYFGYGGGSKGSLTVSDGTVSINQLQLGYNGNSTGSVTIDGGKTTFTGNARIGNSGTGTITQTNGEVTSTGTMYIGDNSSGTGTISISGGTWNATQFVVGTRGTGNLNISGNASVTMSSSLVVAYAATSGARGTVSQTGGTVNVQGEGIQYGLGTDSNTGTGVYNLSGGTLTANRVWRTKDGVTAEFNVSGTGKATITGDISVPTTVSGGSLTAGSISGSDFTQSGGTTDLATLSATNSALKGGTMTVGSITTDFVQSGSSTLAPGGVGTIGTTEVSGAYTIERGPGTENVALGKAASMSTVYNAAFPASKAVDGITITGETPDTYNFAHTSGSSGTDQWWQVDLGETTTLGAIKLYNRYANGSRLTNNGSTYHFELYSGTLDDLGERVWTSPSYSTYTPGIEFNYTDADGAQGRVLRIVRDFADPVPSGDEVTLNLVELEAYAMVNPTLSFDIAADANDTIALLSGASLDLDNAILSLNFLDGVTPEAGDSWQLFDIQDGATLAGDFAEILSNIALAPGLSWDTSRLHETGVLSFGAESVPEPSTWVLLLIGATFVGMRVRRRK
ncbi:MAG: discoidin domain-containing protein [Planctomycetia bacterium]|nr:discoidin domain-containing protein [Planctomycetia bacterium]